MKEEILLIAGRLMMDYYTTEEAKEELLKLFEVVDYVSVYQKTPPINTQLLVKLPDGSVRLGSWRPSYNIFDFQSKGESSMDYQWKIV